VLEAQHASVWIIGIGSRSVSYRPEVLAAQRALSQSIERIRHRERVFSVELPRLSTHQGRATRDERTHSA